MSRKKKAPLLLLALVAGVLLAVAGGTLAGKTSAGTISGTTGTVPEPQTCADINLDAPKNPAKVSLCHFTGSDKPWVFNEVSVSGAASHLDAPDHHGDCGRYGPDAHTAAPDRAGTTYCNLP